MSYVAKFQPSREECRFGPWHIFATKSHILASEGAERQEFEAQLNLPHVPEMIFAQNILRIDNDAGFGIEFSALEALKRVDKGHEDLIQVANAKEWKEARADCEHIENIVHPFDWTFATDYSGTLIGGLTVELTEEKIDIERLKGREKIHFFADLPLFEDELHDCGCSTTSVKIRVMPAYFFVLMRFYMRVDGVLVRVNDTRLFHEAGKDYILREYTSRESKVDTLKVSTTVLTDPNEIVEHLAIKTERREKLVFPLSTSSVASCSGTQIDPLTQTTTTAKQT